MKSEARDTVNIDESVHEIYRQLTEGNDPINAPFKTMKDVFLWAVCLGYVKNDPKPITGKKVTIFRVAQFNAQVDMPLVKAIYLSIVNNVEPLADQDKMLNILEEYANGGAIELKSMLSEREIMPLWNLANYQYGVK